MLKTQEHYDLMEQFERDYKGRRMEREKNKALWILGNIYEDGQTNELFKAYRLGYAFSKAQR